jgi:hypothetical protein
MNSYHNDRAECRNGSCHCRSDDHPSDSFGRFCKIVAGGYKLSGIVIGVHPGQNPPDGWKLELATQQASHQYNIFATLSDQVQFLVLTPHLNPHEIDRPIYARTNVKSLEVLVAINEFFELSGE